MYKKLTHGRSLCCRWFNLILQILSAIELIKYLKTNDFETGINVFILFVKNYVNVFVKINSAFTVNITGNRTPASYLSWKFYYLSLTFLTNYVQIFIRLYTFLLLTSL